MGSASRGKMHPFIPFNKPAMVGSELEYIRDAVAGGNLAGDGEFSHRASRILMQTVGSPQVLLTPSCTAALELAVMTLGWGPGDEVILPSFTFVSTANAVVRSGATPVFVDIDPQTLTMDPSAVRKAITPKTKGMIPVHYAGVPAAMDELMEIARSQGLSLVEDAAHAVGSVDRGRPLGSMGCLAAISFHETKNVQSGQGGALLINDPELRARAEILRDKGTNRAEFLRGHVDKYTWIDVGAAFQMSELTAAYLSAQLERLDEINNRRRGLYDRYMDRLRPLAENGEIQLPEIPPHIVGNGHIAYLLTRDARTRDALLGYLNDRDIWAVFHYLPLHESPRGARLGYQPGDLPVTEDRARRLIRLPMYHELTEEYQNRVVAVIEEFFSDRRTLPNSPLAEVVPHGEAST